MEEKIYNSNVIHSTHFPCLQFLTQKAGNTNIHIILIVHVLETAVKYIELINTVFHVDLIVAIPYSCEPNAVNKLRDKGFQVHIPETVEDAFISTPKIVCEAIKNSTHPILIHEVGGYLAGVTKQLKTYNNFLGIVEGTKNGYWRYEKTGPHDIAIFTIAQSPLKDIECTIIGDAAIYSTERILREEFSATIAGLKSGIIGFGRVGTSASGALKGRKSYVSVYDINPICDIRAKLAGYNILPLRDILATSDLVIGCTGQTSVKVEDIPFLKQNSVLVSATAKAEEFDLDAFNDIYKYKELSDVVRQYERPDGSKFYLFNKGTPINFRDRSVLGPILDMVYSELFVAMKYVSDLKAPKGLSDTGFEIYNEVALAWLNTYEHNFVSDKNEKVWKYPDSLAFGITKTLKMQLQEKNI